MALGPLTSAWEVSLFSSVLINRFHCSYMTLRDDYTQCAKHTSMQSIRGVWAHNGGSTMGHLGQMPPPFPPPSIPNPSFLPSFLIQGPKSVQLEQKYISEQVATI